VDAVDLSEAALAVANRNIRMHQLSERVRSVHSDLFGSLSGETYDVIVSNPPYVSHAEMASLPAEYQAEPNMGFDGGPDGLLLVHRLLSAAADFLSESGVLYVEVGSSAEALQSCYPKVPFLWQEFEMGGDGVFMLTRDQLLAHADEFKAQANG
jgi:ribosomal protein L3 glutamine methyltransferase